MLYKLNTLSHDTSSKRLEEEADILEQTLIYIYRVYKKKATLNINECLLL